MSYTFDFYIAVPGSSKSVAAVSGGKSSESPRATGDITFPVTHTVNHLGLCEGLNLVGNPFHGYLDASEFLTNNSDIEDYYIVYDAQNWNENHTGTVPYNGYTIGNDRKGFRYYTPGASSGGEYAQQYLHPHQGFFVQTNSEGTVSFNQNMIVTRAQASWAGQGLRNRPAYPLVNLYLSSEKGCSDVCVVEFNRPEWGGARKLRDMYWGNGVLYASHDNEGYAALFATPDVDRIPLKFEAMDDEGDTYTIDWTTANADFSKLFLVDNLTGVRYDMLADTSYTFQGKRSDYWSRFYIEFDVTGLEEEYDDDPDDDPTGTHFAFFNGSEWVVTNTATTGATTLDLIDLQGRVLMHTTLGPGGQTTVSLPDVAKGMYLLRLNNHQGTKVQKIVVN